MKGLVYCISILCIVACSKQQRDDCFTALGDQVNITRQLASDFDKLLVNDRIHLVILQDSTKAGKLQLTAPEGLIKQISSDVNNGKLSLVNDNTCNFVRNYDYSITGVLYINQLIEITIESIASIDIPDTIMISDLTLNNSALSDNFLRLKGNSILVESSNSASTYLEGELSILRGNIEEISELEASSLVAEEVILDTHTPFDTYVNASDGIYVKIYNSGNVIYDTEPKEYKIVAERTGIGNLLKK